MVVCLRYDPSFELGLVDMMYFFGRAQNVPERDDSQKLCVCVRVECVDMKSALPEAVLSAGCLEVLRDA